MGEQKPLAGELTYHAQSGVWLSHVQSYRVLVKCAGRKLTMPYTLIGYAQKHVKILAILIY